MKLLRPLHGLLFGGTPIEPSHERKTDVLVLNGDIIANLGRKCNNFFLFFRIFFAARRTPLPSG